MLRDRREIARLKALAVPPAYADVRFAASAVEALIAYALEGSKILDGWRITGATAEPITSDAPIE